MATPMKYPTELRERAIRIALDVRRNPATRPGTLARIVGELGINPEMLRNGGAVSGGGVLANHGVADDRGLVRHR